MKTSFTIVLFLIAVFPAFADGNADSSMNTTQTRKVTVNSNYDYEMYEEREPAIAGILSFLVPGAGQFYNKQFGKGVTFLGLSYGLSIGGIVSIVVAYNEDPDFRDGSAPTWGIIGAACLVGATVTGIWSIVDAVVSANEINESLRALRKGSSFLLYEDDMFNVSLNPVIRPGAFNGRVAVSYYPSLELGFQYNF